MTAAEREQLRREGMADAIVLLVARRVLPRLDLDDFARPLDLSRLELQEAVRRFKQRTRPPLKAVEDPPASSKRYGEPHPCPKGCGRSFVHFGRHLAFCTGMAS